MITFLASPKPFNGIAKEHQYRAIQSWQAAGVDVEVILYGDSDGIAEAGVDLGVKVVKQIDCSPSGIPYFGSIINHAAIYGKHDLQVYLNCDILMSGIHSAMIKINFSQFLMVGQLIDLGENQFIDVTQTDWESSLKKLFDENVLSLRTPRAIDYFGFRRGLFKNIAPIVIGRAGYDNAVLAYCLHHNIPIVDATLAVTALHQFHDYGHVQGGKQTVWSGQDALNNVYHAGKHSLPSISDSSYVLRNSVVLPWKCRKDRLRRMELIIRYRLGYPTLSLAVRLVWKILQVIKFTRSITPTLEEVIVAILFNRTKIR